MKKVIKTAVMTIGVLLFTASTSWASTVVYEKVELFQTETFFTDMFEITDAGNYQATLTDFDFLAPMELTGLNVTTATESLGSLVKPGSFTFDAEPGEYYVSFYGLAGKPPLPSNYGIEISQVVVPVPAAVWLFGSGLLGLVGIARRKKA